jgi:signal transduction histidine kinase
MARRLGCAAGCLLLVFVSALTAIVWLVLSAAGVVSSAPFTIIVAGIAVILGTLAVVAAVMALRRVATPISRLIAGARRIEAGDYSARVPVRGPSDLRSLARAFNEMSGRLEAEETRRRSVLADVAHELRTPLTIIRSQSEAIADSVYPPDAEHMAPIIAATKALEVLIDDLRTLTLAESGSLDLKREPVDVDVLVNETLDAFRAEATDAGVTLVERVDAAIPPVDADPARLRGVMGNLVSNALAHSRRGGTVTVEGRAVNGTVRLTVRDDGEGIPADLLPRIFDRFVKGSSSTGSGLGLAIVRDVIEAHGGRVSAESSPAQGTAIHVDLPAASEP